MTNTTPLTKPEVMSPAGYWPQLHAAVEAGADAVYFGLRHFSARAKVGFDATELPEVMAVLHRRGVKGYVTFNTLVFDHELTAAATSLAEIARAGADAIIVQDLAVAELARRIAPGLDVHGSTQMSITSAEGVALAQQAGVTRVVLARELSLDEVRAIRAKTDCELEMFVHGALCVSYSGQCYSSEAWGGRSANRGQCAQACRLPYDLMVDGEQHPLGDVRYLLSPGDLYALHHVPEIVQIGIAALKIEGRYKDANYVALTTQAYRQAVDAAWSGLPIRIQAEDEIALEQVYSRGLGAHFVGGTDHQQVVRGRSPRHRGVLAGQVTQLLDRAVKIRLEPAMAAAPLKAGDGVVFDAADWRSPEEPEEGGRIYEVLAAGDHGAELRFANGAINFGRIRPGDWIWRTHDPDVDKRARPFTHSVAPVHKQPVTVHVTAQVGAPLQLRWSLVNAPHVAVTVETSELLAAASQQPLDDNLLWKQLGRLGNTPYKLTGVDLQIAGAPFVPASLLNQMRRQAVEKLVERQSRRPYIIVHDPITTLAELAPAIQTLEKSKPARRMPHPQLHFLVRTPDQLEAALVLEPASITLDYLDLYGLRPAVERVAAAGITPRVASPRILKPNEQRIVNFLLRLDCEILVRSSGLLFGLQGQTLQPLTGDFGLNVANIISARRYLALGLTRLTPSHDLNADQIAALAETLEPEQLEVIAYHHLPVFHTEYCVFCRFLSAGISYKDCGHPCEHHQVALRDGSSRSHPVMADVGCRNTVFGAEAQTADRHLDAWRAAGILHFRLEFVHESGDQVMAIAGAFRAAFEDRLPTRQLGERLRASAPQGTTEGSFFVPVGYQEIPLV